MRYALLALGLAACGAGEPVVDASVHADAGVPADAALSGSNDGALVRDAGTCGTRTSMRGLTQRSLELGGLHRTYLVYLPASLDATKPVPLVFVFHGYTMSGQQMHDITQYTTLADEQGFAVVFPDGESGTDSDAFPWNVASPGETVCGEGEEAMATGDDFAFIDAMKADVATDQCPDEAHLFATGFSMGGYMSHHIGCHRSDFRSVAPHSGGAPASLGLCTTGHVPIIIFHGDADPLIANACDDPTAIPLPGYTASATLWAEHNGCASTYTKSATTGTGGGTGTCYVYDGCPADGQVELCTFAGMGHAWAGGSTSGQGAVFASPPYASALALEWAFWKAHAW